MEKVIIKPQRVRCLGNIVSPKSTANFTNVDAVLSRTDDSVNGVTGIYTLSGD